MVGSYSESSLHCDWRFQLFLQVQISRQARHFVNLYAHISWQADFVAGTALCEPPCAEFVAGAALCEPQRADCMAGAALANLHAQISWQAQHFVNLHASPNLEGKLRGTTVARRSRVMSADHSRNPCIKIRGFSADFVAGTALCKPPCADFVAGAALCEPRCADFVASTALCEPPCADFAPGAALCEPPCADFVAGAPPCADFVAGAALYEPPCADFVAGTALLNLEVQILWQDSTL